MFDDTLALVRPLIVEYAAPHSHAIRCLLQTAAHKTDGLRGERTPGSLQPIFSRISNSITLDFTVLAVCDVPEYDDGISTSRVQLRPIILSSLSKLS